MKKIFLCRYDKRSDSIPIGGRHHDYQGGGNMDPSHERFNRPSELVHPHSHTHTHITHSTPHSLHVLHTSHIHLLFYMAPNALYKCRDY